MDKFLEGCLFLRINQEEVENMNRPVTSTKLKLIKTPQQMSRTRWIRRQTISFREELISILLKLVQNITEEGTLPIHSMKLPTYHDTKTKDTTKKESNKPLSLINIDIKTLNKIVANYIQQYIQRIMHSEQVELIPWMQEFFSICKSISVMHHINKLKK